MLRFSHIVAAALTLGVIALLAVPLQAGTVSMAFSSPSGFAEDPLAILPSLDDPLAGFALDQSNAEQTAAARPITTKPKSAPKPVPQRPQHVQIEQQELVTQVAATTMTGGPSVTTTSPITATLAAVFIPAPELSLEPDGSLLCFSDWIFIPPRFLDGVFRPPRILTVCNAYSF